MSLRLLLLILTSVSLSAAAQLVLKSGMSSSAVQEALASANYWHRVFGVATAWKVGLGLGLYGFGAVLWLLVLAKVDVSAYPFVSLGFILTTVFAWWLLCEPVRTSQLIGTLLITIGVYLVARS